MFGDGPTTLTTELLVEFEGRLRAAKVLSVEHARPGLSSQEIYAVAENLGVEFGEEAYTWWG